MNGFRLLLLTCSGAFLVGCTSLDVHSEVDRKPYLYPGVREDFREIRRVWSGPFFFLVCYNVIDTPFSFVIDTLYLPFDAYYQHQVRAYQESLRRFPPDPNPLAAWKHTPDDALPDPTIVADYETYIEQLPQDQKKVLIVNPYMVRLFEDGKGAHAMEIRLYLKHTEWKYVLIYDESNRRVKELKYADGHLVP